MSLSFKIVQYKNLSNWSVSHLLANQFNYNEDFKLDVGINTDLLEDTIKDVIKEKVGFNK